MQLQVTGMKGTVVCDMPGEIVLAMAQVNDVFIEAGARPVPGSDEGDGEYIVDCARLCGSLRAAGKQLSKEDDNAGYIYSFTHRIPTAKGFPAAVASGSGRFRGFRINGVIHALEAGHELCVLEQWEVNEAGKGRCVMRGDVRHLSYIDTDDFGRIEIKKRRAVGEVSKWINSVVRKLKKLEGDVVVELA